jgi:hypothetical protein
MENDDLKSISGHLMASRIDFRVRIWETIKVAAALAGGSLAAVGALVATGKMPEMFPAFAIFLIAFGIYLARWTYSNVSRESALQYHDEFCSTR